MRYASSLLIMVILIRDLWHTTLSVDSDVEETEVSYRYCIVVSTLCLHHHLVFWSTFFSQFSSHLVIFISFSSSSHRYCIVVSTPLSVSPYAPLLLHCLQNCLILVNIFLTILFSTCSFHDTILFYSRPPPITIALWSVPFCLHHHLLWLY